MQKIKSFVSFVAAYVKLYVLLVLYVLGTATFGYGMWFAIKNHKNGKGFLVNFIAGILSGIGKILGKAIETAFPAKSSRC
jgi:hypothetical protein